MVHIPSIKNLVPSVQVTSLNSGTVVSSSAGSRTKEYFHIGVYGGSMTRFWGVGCDNKNNIYASGGMGNYLGLVISWDSSGNSRWSRLVTNSDQGQITNFYVNRENGSCYGAASYSPGGSSNGIFGLGLDTSGTLLWSKYYSASGGNSIVFSPSHYKSYRTGSSRFVITETMYDGSFQMGAYNLNQSDGSLNWGKYAKNNPTNNYYPYGAAETTDGTIFVVGGYNGDTDAAIHRYTSGGSLSSTLRSAQSNNFARNYRAVVPDRLGNFVYALRSTTNNPANKITLDKWNTSGTRETLPNNGQIWGVSVMGLPNQSLTWSYPTSLAVDSSGNIYAIAIRNNVSPNRSNLFKFDTNGNVLWQRELYYSGYATYAYGVEVDANDDVVVSGYFTNTSYDEGWVLKVPADGSKTGSYSVTTYNGSRTFVYESVSYQTYQQNGPFESYTNTDASGSTSGGNTGYTNSSPSRTETKTNI